MRQQQLVPLKTSQLPSRAPAVVREANCCGGASASGECDECRQQRLTDESVDDTETRQSRLRPSAGAIPVIRESPGDVVRAVMARRFGQHSFENVRIFAATPSGKSSETLSFGRAGASRGAGGTAGARRQPRNGWELTASLSIDRPAAAKPSNINPGDGEAVRFAQAVPGDGGAAPIPAGPAGPAAPAAPAAGCSYTITYANVQNLGCPAGSCGAKIRYDVTGVTASGSGCPATLNGLQLTETVSTDNGCTPGGVTTGAGCPITATAAAPLNGTITGCTDTYGLCDAPASFPASGCTEIYTQRLSVGGVLAETRKITFKITKTGGGCSGTVARS